MGHILIRSESFRFVYRLSPNRSKGFKQRAEASPPDCTDLSWGHKNSNAWRLRFLVTLLSHINPLLKVTFMSFVECYTPDSVTNNKSSYKIHKSDIFCPIFSNSIRNCISHLPCHNAQFEPSSRLGLHLYPCDSINNEEYR